MSLHPNLRLLALAAVAAITLAPYAADSGTCMNPAARDLLATSYADAQLNNPKGEDTNFFIKAGGVPNIMLLLDTSGSMNRLPPDGPNNFGLPLPPGYVGGDANQASAFAANSTTPAPNTRIVGCGLDAVSAGSAAFVNSAMYQELEARRFYSSCAQAVDNSLIASVYKGHGVDYAANMTVCPSLDTGLDNFNAGKAGYDPEYYDGGDPTATATTSKPNFFGRNLVFHDNPDRGSQPWARDSAEAFGHNFGDGFNSLGLWPHLDKATGNKSTISSFCDQQGKVAPQMQGGVSHASICNTCLNTKGWYYDGVIYTAGENGARTPSLWYTGNYLNFFPPKFLITRKVVKDIIAVQERVRMALAVLGKPIDTDFSPTCDHPDSSFVAARATFGKSINAFAFSPNNGTPLAVSLFNMGRYYHSPDLQWFGKTWERTDSGLNNWESGSNVNNLAVCYSCQTSSIILMTDGQPSAGDGDGDDLPPGGFDKTTDLKKKAGDPTTGIRDITTAACPECNEFRNNGVAGDDYKDNLAKVAFYLHNMDLRDDNEATGDCLTNSGAQVLDVYTVGFATKSIPSANKLLANAASAGGGMFVSASNTQELKEGFNAILEEINGRSTSFSVATVSTLQTMSGSAAHVPRFSPAKTAHWPGRLFRYELYSEFVHGCTPFGADDYNCDGRCDGVFLIDADSKFDAVTGKYKELVFISEDTNGAFVQNNPPDKPVCTQAPRCGGPPKCGVPGSNPANPFWDAAESWGKAPSDVDPKWKQRSVWTAVDSDGDGDIEQDDGMVDLTGASDAAVKAITPYLALGGGSVCNLVAARLATAGDLASSLLVADPHECAKAILRYVLGADLFNERGLDPSLYPKPSMDQAVDRAFLLGDIFHSSPAKVIAPLPSNSRVCRLGLENQCTISLWDTDTKNGVAGYAEYQKSGLYRDRPRIVLVGGNDGMLHAFDDAFFVKDGEGGGTYQVVDETKELWGFIPPDLIAKLPLLLGNEHQLFVDGTAMVRDVWVDGEGNDLGGGTKDDIKEGTEFHTVAVVGERRGGTRFFALDVTDATRAGSAPRFLWIYPQPNSKESLSFGETYNDFLPTPPPIGPVRVATGGIYPTNPDSPKYRHDGSNTPFHETWVAFLNGGYDPQYVRGRGVHMVDVWTGKELWDFSYPDNPASIPAADPRHQLRFPVPAVVGMIRWGTSEKLPNETDPDGADNYFDTATFGDAGGQLWTLRFHEPAKLDANGLATNWFGARSFQMGGKTGCKLCGGQPFFQITANAPTPADRLLRTYAGTGDRFNLTDKFGGTCSPTNLRACVMRGCTVTVSQAGNLLSAPGPGFVQRGMSEVACNALTSSQLAGSTVSCVVDAHSKIEITGCPSPEEVKGLTATTREMAMSCIDVADGSGYQCSRVTNVPGVALSLSNTTNAPVTGNWFLSLRMFREGLLPVFKTAAQAQNYDAQRHWVTQSNAARASSGPVLLDSTLPGGTATEDSAGWAMYYNHLNTVTIDGTSVNVDWKDERTASGTAIAPGLVSWNTVIPPTSGVTAKEGGGCWVSRCTQEDRRVNFMYGADPVSGAAAGSFLDASGKMVRSIASYRLVPAQAMQSTYFVNSKGQVQQALTGISPEAGAINVGSTEAEDAMSEADFLVVDRELYECRHADAPICK